MADPHATAAVTDVAGWALRRLLEAMPKAELHLHLDGSVRVATALDLARTRGVAAPPDWAGMYGALVAPERCTDQAELLRAFELPIALMQDAEALERITAELVTAKAADNVRYVEIRWGPLLHVARGLPLVDQGLTGWDLAGPEAAYPDPLDHARAFEVARAGGLRITIHAGEWGGPAQVRRALAVDPERIAHGPLTIDDPGLCRELADRGITLDLCPTSNVQA